MLIEEFQKLDLPENFVHLDKNLVPESRAGFLVLKTMRAGEIQQQLMQAGVFTDNRGDSLRFGPAPYLSDQQLKEAMRILGDVVRKMK